MFTKWLRTSKLAAGILTMLRIYLGFGFLSAGWGKLTAAKGFSAAGFLTSSISHPVLLPDKSIAYPWYQSFLNGVALPHIGVFNVLVPYGEFLVGVGLILGVLTTTAAFFGLLMNFMYMFAGSVSSNPLFILIGAFIMAAGYNAGRFGGDYLVIPYLRKLTKRALGHDVKNNTRTPIHHFAGNQ